MGKRRNNNKNNKLAINSKQKWLFNLILIHSSINRFSFNSVSSFIIRKRPTSLSNDPHYYYCYIQIYIYIVVNNNNNNTNDNNNNNNPYLKE